MSCSGFLSRRNKIRKLLFSKQHLHYIGDAGLNLEDKTKEKIIEKKGPTGTEKLKS
jgi:hypothetical protein